MEITKRVTLTSEMKDKKKKGYKYIVTYNDTTKFFVFKDTFFKTKKQAIEFYNSLDYNLKAINSL